MQRRLHPLPALRHRLVGQADNMHAELAWSHHDLDIDGHALNPLKCNCADPRDHVHPPALPSGHPPWVAGHQNCNQAYSQV
jgi:hypothetical protein